MTHDPHCPAPEMCSSCGEFPVPDTHDCESPEESLLIRGVILAVVFMDCLLAWAVWNELKYGGFR